jgi:hypothetical protein
VAPSAADLDAHLLAAFTSPGRLGRDGHMHQPKLKASHRAYLPVASSKPTVKAAWA